MSAGMCLVEGKQYSETLYNTFLIQNEHYCIPLVPTIIFFHMYMSMK